MGVKSAWFILSWKHKLAIYHTDFFLIFSVSSEIRTKDLMLAKGGSVTIVSAINNFFIYRMCAVVFCLGPVLLLFTAQFSFLHQWEWQLVLMSKGINHSVRGQGGNLYTTTHNTIFTVQSSSRNVRMGRAVFVCLSPSQEIIFEAYHWPKLVT